MSKHDVLVIGGGLNGLVAATILARKGKKVCLIEQSDRLGGMAAAGADGQSRIAHLLYNLSPVVRREIGMDAHKWPFATTPLPTVVLSADAKHVVVRGSTVSFSDGSAHPEADTYRALMHRLKQYGALLRQLAEGPPPGLDGGLTSKASLKQLWRLGRLGLDIKRMDKPELRRFLQVLLSNAFDMILDELKDGPLAGLLAADAVRGAAAGPRSPGTVFSLIYRMGHGAETQLPTDGMGSVIDAFAQAATKAGVEIRTGASVARILSEGDAVTGVETSQGESLSAGTILSSTGALRIAEMTGFAQFDVEATRRMRNIRARGTAAKVNLTLKAAPTIPGLPDDLGAARFVLAPSADYVERAFNPSKYREMSEQPVIEAILTDDARLSAIVQYAPVDLEGGWSKAAKDRLLKITLAALEASMPGLGGLVESAEVITPDQIEAETGAPGGHWHHAEMTMDQVLTLRPANGIGRYAMGPKGLYLCGASSHPGGDLIGLAGRNAALKALEDMA